MDMRELSGTMSVFYILTGMVATRYIFVKTHQTVLLNLHSTAGKLRFNKVEKERKKQMRKEGT